MKHFLLGIALATLVWIGALGYMLRRYEQETMRIGEEAFQEAYEVKQQNKKLTKENRHLQWLLKERKVG